MVPWMSGLVNGLQNRLQQFESARHLKRKSRNLKYRVSGFLFSEFSLLAELSGGAVGKIIKRKEDTDRLPPQCLLYLILRNF